MSSSSSSSPSQDIKIDGIQSNRYGSANGSSRSDASSIEPSCDKMLKSKESKLNTGHDTASSFQKNLFSRGLSKTNDEKPIDLVNIILEGESLAYIPRLDYKPVLISKLPNEVMLCIITHLALHATWTIPSIARVCKQFFLYTRDPIIWKYVCVRVFQTPYMTLKESDLLQKSYISKYNGSWLCMFIARSRIRYDGVYISTCEYVRPGVSDTGWNQPVHLVTYYRYVRFFSNGTVLHHITTKEPHKVVHGLNQSLNKRQTFHGVYHHLRGDHVQIEMRDPNVPREKFCLTLKVKPVTKIRRQIKLGWRSYSSMPAMTEGEQRTIDISNFKPFLFSPVRTYKVDY